MNIYCPKCGTENTSGVRYCRNCGVEIDTVAALLDGRLVVSEESGKKGFLSKPGWEKALITFSFGVALLILGFILGFDHLSGSPTFWLGLLFLAFPLIGFGVGQMVRLSTNTGDRVELRPGTPVAIPPADAKELPGSRTEYVSPEAGRPKEEGEFVPHSVVESTTRNLEMSEEPPILRTEDPSETSDQ